MKYEDLCRKLAGCFKEERVPSVAKLEKSNAKVIFRTTQDIKDGLTVFDNGYVVFGNGIRVTVFAIITYWYKKRVLDDTGLRPREGHMADPRMEEANEYGVKKWVSEMAAFGEKRLAHNDSSQVEKYEVATDDFSFVPDENIEVGCFDQGVCDQVYVEGLMECLNKKQSTVIRLHFWNGYTFEQIAGLFNAVYEKEGKDKRVSRQSVAQVADRAIKKMRKRMEKDEKYKI